jgi:hypothetical protein
MKRAALIVGAGVLAVLAIVPAVLYGYVIGISAGLCGDDASVWPKTLAVGVPLLVIGSWGVRNGKWIIVAWPAAVLSAAACLSLAAYLDSGAHGHCETMTPYSRTPVLPVKYS